MSSVLDKFEVLKLNKLWEPISFVTVRKALGDFTTWLADGRGNLILDSQGCKQTKMTAIDIEFTQLADGSYNFDSAETTRPVTWDEWVTLPVRSYDLVIHTSKKAIRVPRIVVALTYDEMPKKKFPLNYDMIYRLYNGICAYTKKKLKRSEGSMDHYIPRARGGKHEISNLRFCDRKVNSLKGHKLNSEIGLPEVPPIIPPDELPMSHYLKNEKNVPEWKVFLKN